MPAPTAPLRHIKANGLNFGYFEQGSGPLLILLHGFPDNAETYANQLEAFSAAGYRVVAPYLRGYFPTEVPADGKVDPATLADDLHGLITALSDTGKAYVMGMDWGGTTIQAALAKYPEDIMAAVVMNTAHPATFPVSSRDPKFIQSIFHLWYFQTSAAQITVPVEGLPFVDHLWEYWSPSLKDPAHIASIKATLNQPGTLPIALKYYSALVSSFQNQSFPLGAIATPTLSIFGCNDATAMYAHEEEKVFVGPYNRVMLPDVGHFPHRERESEVNALALDWFAAHKAH